MSLFLFGIFYHLHPTLDAGRAALVQVWIWIVGTAILGVGVAMVHTGHPNAEPIAAVGSFILLAAMLVFAWLVFRRNRVGAAGRPS